MKSESPSWGQQVESGARYLSATFFVVLGAINFVHNLLPLFQGGAGSLWPVVLGMICFGLGPLLLGIWLVLQPEAKRATGKRLTANAGGEETAAQPKA